jgi:Bacterial Ig-like domain
LGEASDKTAAELQVAASIPTNEATDVAPDVRMVVRFTRPLQVSTVTALTVNLRSEAGPVGAKVVAAEAGMLAFVTPDQPLSPGTLYTLSITGARDASDFPLPNSEIALRQRRPPSLPRAGPNRRRKRRTIRLRLHCKPLPASRRCTDIREPVSASTCRELL